MKELLMTDVNEKFAEARKLCPGWVKLAHELA